MKLEVLESFTRTGTSTFHPNQQPWSQGLEKLIPSAFCPSSFLTGWSDYYAVTEKKYNIFMRVPCMIPKNISLRPYQRRVWCMSVPGSVRTYLDYRLYLVRMLQLLVLCVRMVLLKMEFKLPLISTTITLYHFDPSWHWRLKRSPFRGFAINWPVPSNIFLIV